MGKDLKEYEAIHIKLEKQFQIAGFSKNKFCHREELQRSQMNNLCKNRVVRIDLSVLARICTVLSCGFGDILEFIPPDK